MNLALIAAVLGGAGTMAMIIGAVIAVIPARLRQYRLMALGMVLLLLSVGVGFNAPPLQESCAAQTKNAAYDIWEKTRKTACDYWPWCEQAPRR